MMRALLAAAFVFTATVAAADSGSEAALRKLLADYDAAFAAKDLAGLGRFYLAEASIYEGGSIDRGWASYRDHHLGPELRGMDAPRLTHSDVRVVVLSANAAYVTSEYRLQARMEGRDIDVGGLETLILTRDPERGWLIRHSHTSSKPRPGPAASPSPSPRP